MYNFGNIKVQMFMSVVWERALQTRKGTFEKG